MTKERSDQIAAALSQRFTAHVESEEVSPGRFRFDVFSKHFGDVSHLTRQDQAWEVVDHILSREESDDVSIILTAGPEDVDASLVALMPA
jgi:hypothetical protein